jgi:hypothetical protein
MIVKNSSSSPKIEKHQLDPVITKERKNNPTIRKFLRKEKDQPYH